jgi:hypothetical protein
VRPLPAAAAAPNPGGYHLQVMSSIITIRHNFGRNGLLKHRDLPHIWKAPEFRHCRPLLLSLLQHFEVLLLLLLLLLL